MLALFILFSPQLILQAGFQLSYLAVAGILFLYKEIEAKLYFKSWFGKQVWGCLLYTSPSPRDRTRSRMPSSA